MSREVLVVGPPDAEVRALGAALDALGQPWLSLDTRAPLELDLSREGARWRLGDRCLLEERWGQPAICAIGAVYTRLLALPPSRPPDSPWWTVENLRRAGFYDAEILSLKLAFLRHLEELGIPMLNPFSADHDELKPLRLLRMMRAGIPVPETLCTQDPDRLLGLASRKGRLVAKPVAGGAAVRAVEPLDLEPERTALLDRAPVAFQPLAPGKDLRIYVCDGTVLAAVLMHSEAEVDPRGRETGFETIEPPPAATAAALAACSLCGLRFSAVDLRLGPAGEVVLLECNNHPMWANIDRAIGGAVGRGLARRLSQVANGQERMLP